MTIARQTYTQADSRVVSVHNANGPESAHPASQLRWNA